MTSSSLAGLPRKQRWRTQRLRRFGPCIRRRRWTAPSCESPPAHNGDPSQRWRLWNKYILHRRRARCAAAGRPRRPPADPAQSAGRFKPHLERNSPIRATGAASRELLPGGLALEGCGELASSDRGTRAAQMRRSKHGQAMPPDEVVRLLRDGCFQPGPRPAIFNPENNQVRTYHAVGAQRSVARVKLTRAARFVWRTVGVQGDPREPEKARTDGRAMAQQRRRQGQPHPPRRQRRPDPPTLRPHHSRSRTASNRSGRPSRRLLSISRAPHGVLG